ncbi:MAG TPA: hypothetical protein P5522_11155 [Spirochaetia bacterium]|nr:hypothetical protein [Spirochaetia bacterium]
MNIATTSHTAYGKNFTVSIYFDKLLNKAHDLLVLSEAYHECMKQE